MHLRVVEPDAACLVAEERIVLPTIPQCCHDIMELRRAFIAQRMVHMRIEAEVHRLVLGLRRHQVPADPAAADMVDGQEPPRDIVWFVVAGRACRDQPEMRRDRREPGDRADRLDMCLAPAARIERLAAIQPGTAGDRHAVLEEHRIQPAVFSHACHFGKMAETEVGLGDRVRVAPSGRMAARHVHERAEPQLTPGLVRFCQDHRRLALGGRLVNE